jgi:anti-repressor protein
MTEIIAITKQNIGNQEINSVNARDLWEYLDSQREFATWIKSRIEKFEFQEGIDFCRFDKIVKTGGINVAKPLKEYIITIDMAKELAMVENNDKGRQARRYFIEVEKKYQEQAQVIPETHEGKIALIHSLSGIALEKIEENKKLQSDVKLLTASNNEKNELIKAQGNKLEKQAPIVKLADDIRKSDGLKSMTQCAKEFKNCGRNKLFKFCFDMGIFYREDGIPVVKQYYEDMGYFKPLPKVWKNEKAGKSGMGHKIYVTAKGYFWLKKGWDKHLESMFV